MDVIARLRTRRTAIRGLVGTVVVVLVIGLLAGATRAAPVGLDPTFGSNGQVTTQVPNRDVVAEDVAVQADGKIVAAGWLRDNTSGWPEPMSFLIARYNVDGTLDQSFGNGGMATATVGPSSGANSVAIQSDGRIVAGGFTREFPGTFALARFNSDGTLDQTFGDAGKVITNAGFNTAINDLAIQADGKLVAAGGNGDSGDARNFIAARYLVNGSLDPTFGAGGLTYTNFFGRGGMAQGVVVQPDGKIVEVGQAGLTSYPFDALALVRFNSDGTLDATFGTGGKVTTSFEGGGGGWAVALRPDGKLVAAGVARTNTGNGGFGLARYNPDGTLDASFGTGGTVFTDFGGSGDAARAVALHDDGKVVAAGHWVTPAFSGDFALAQYKNDGSLDTGFGVGGKVTTDFNGASEAVNGLAIQADGKVVAAGVVAPSPGLAMFGLARYLGADTTPPALDVSVSPQLLWPPNHRYVTVRATVSATDDSGSDSTVELVSVTSNEADDGPGDGDTVHDIVTTDEPYTFQLRAERNEKGTGRIYTVTYRATDGSGNSATQSATVTVPVTR